MANPQPSSTGQESIAESYEPAEVMSPNENREGIDDLDTASRQAAGIDANASYTAEIASATPEQIGNIETNTGVVSRQAVASLLGKLKRADPNLDISRIAPHELPDLIKQHHLNLNQTENAVLHSVLSGASVDWNSVAAEVEKASGGLRGLWDKYTASFKDNPTKTILFTLLGALGIYASVKVVKWFAKKGVESAKRRIADTIFSPMHILGLLGLAGFGAMMNKDTLKDILYKRFNLLIGDREAVDALRDIQDGKVPKGLQSKVQGAKEGVKAKAEKAKQGLFARLGLEHVDNGNASQQHAQFSEFIKKTNDDLEVPAHILAKIGDGSYEDFLKKSPDIIGGLMGLMRSLTGNELEKLPKEAQDLLKDSKIKNLALFFSKMVKHGGDPEKFPEFQGKTINQVMALISDPENKDKYLDAEAVAEANKKNEHFQKALAALKSDPRKILSDTESRQQFLKDLTLGGGVMFIDIMGHSMVKIVNNAGDVWAFTGKEVYGVAEKLANWFWDSENDISKATGAYLHVAKYTMAIGAPTLMTTKFLYGLTHGHGLILSIAEGALGTIKGVAKGAMLPARAAKVLAWDLPLGKTGWKDAEAAFDRNIMLMFEDLSINRFLSRFGARTLPEKMLAGEADPSNARIMRRLQIYRNYFEKQHDEFIRLADKRPLRRSIYTQYSNRYRKAKEQIDRIFRALEWDSTINDGKGGFKRGPLDIKLKEWGFSDQARDVLTKNKRIAIVLLDKEHPMAQLVGRLDGEKTTQLIRLLNDNDDVFKQLVRYPELALDHQVRAAFDTGDTLDDALFTRVVKERVGVWKKFSRRELFTLGEQPLLTGRYTQLKDLIAAQERSVFSARRAGQAADALRSPMRNYRDLQRLLLTRGGEHADLIVRYPDKFSVLFEGTAESQRAIKQFVAIDRQVLKVMNSAEGGTSAIEDLAVQFAKFTENEGTIAKTVAEYERKIGLRGKAKMKLGRLADKVGRGTGNARARVSEEIRRPWRKGAGSALETPQALEPLRIPPLQAAELSELASLNTPTNIADILKAKGIPADMAERMAQEMALTQDTAEIRSILQKGGVVEKAGKIATTLKWAARVLAPAGTAFSAYEAGSSAYEAATTDVEGRAGVASGKAVLYGLDTAVGIGATATAFGSTNAAAVLASRAVVWAPLVAVTYAGTKVYDTLEENTLTQAEWSQRYSYDGLVHQWFSTCGSVSLGDAWVTGFKGMSKEAITKSMEDKKKTSHKIYRVLVASLKYPGILQYIASEAPSREKDQKIEAMINAVYTKYHEYYFRQNPPFFSDITYEKAKVYLTDAQLFDDLMQKRDQVIAAGQTDLKLGSLNLTDSRYDIEGTAEQPRAKGSFSVPLMVARYKQNLLAIDKEMAPHLADNLDSMETPYLLNLYFQIYAAMNDSALKSQLDDDPDFRKIMAKHMALIRNYLTSKRGINFNIAVANEQFAKSRMSLNQLAQHLEGLYAEGAPRYSEYKKGLETNQPGVRALYRLAQHFGYSGYPGEERLKEFFHEDKASYQGIYWDGAWYVQESGLELDDKVGTALDEATVRKMIETMRDHPDDVLEQRHDTVFASAYDFSHQVRTMANLLEKGLNEKDQQKPEQHKQESVEYLAAAA